LVDQEHCVRCRAEIPKHRQLLPQGGYRSIVLGLWFRCAMLRAPCYGARVNRNMLPIWRLCPKCADEFFMKFLGRPDLYEQQ
jgi:hypothetical protein